MIYLYCRYTMFVYLLTSRHYYNYYILYHVCMMKCEMSHIVESRQGFLNKSFQKCRILQKVKKILKARIPSFPTIYDTWGLFSKSTEKLKKISEKISVFLENLVRRINYYHVNYFKHSFKMQFTPYVFVITGKLRVLAFR